MIEAWIEALSWRLITEVVRLYPNRFAIIETHPGGGLYDCLSLCSGNQHIAALNRIGSFTVFQPIKQLGQVKRVEQACERALREGYGKILSEMFRALGLAEKVKHPPSTDAVLIYRCILQALTAALAGKHPWRCLNGNEDTSGYGGGTRVHLFEAFTQTQERLRICTKSDILNLPAYRFWFLLQEDRPILCLETTGWIWNCAGQEFHVSVLYQKRRRVWDILWPALQGELP